MLKTIQEHTIKEAKMKNPNFEVSLEKLEALIGYQYFRGIYGKRHPVELLWNKDNMDEKCFVTHWQGIAL